MGKRKNQKDKLTQRLQFQFTIKRVEELDELTEKIGAVTRAETVRRALRLLEQAVGTGGKVVIEHEDGTRELVIVV